MIRLVTRIIPLLLSLLLSCPWAGGKELKILYWNIQNGMWSDQGNGYDNFVAFVSEVDPDICIWCEAESRYITGSDKKLMVSEGQYLPWNWDLLAARYGHDYTLICGKRDGFPQVITSKYPIKIVKRITGNGDDIIVVHGSGWDTKFTASPRNSAAGAYPEWTEAARRLCGSATPPQAGAGW